MNRTPIVLIAAALVSWTSAAPPRDLSTPQPASASAADSLVDRWIEAAGGLDRYRLLESARYTLTTEIYDTASSRLRRTRPRYVTVARTGAGEISRLERWEGNDFIVQSWDGHAAWATRNGDSLAPGDKDFDEVRYVSGDVQYWISLPFKLRDPGVNLHDRGRDDSGRHLVAVTFGEGVGLHDGDAWRYWFEDGRTWPVELAYREEGKEDWNHLRFEDIREVGGYVFVGRRVHFNARGQLTKVLRTHDFALNPDVDPRVFSEL